MTTPTRLPACDPALSRGRRFAEADAPTRNAFQRDRDRVIHSTAFRRLVYKTQVFLNHEGDLFRTRLTHSLEVAQLGRSIARTLGLNEDLVEAVSLAHDLGHTPFGHAGQDALAECMAQAQARLPAAALLPSDVMGWGFEHNLQSLRVVDALEERYPAFDGLNLCFETREGILKHCSRVAAQRIEALEPMGVAARFLTGDSPSLEAQLCNLADQIAYNAHDVDDGVRSGLLTLEQVAEVPMVGHFLAQALQQHPDLKGRRLLFETIRLMLSEQVYDVIRTTTARVQQAGVCTLADVRQAGDLVAFSDAVRDQTRELKRFLFKALYRHPQVMETTDRARQVVIDLFAAYTDQPGQMPVEYSQRPDLARAVADYIAGMTDRFAVREHQRLTGQKLF